MSIEPEQNRGLTHEVDDDDDDDDNGFDGGGGVLNFSSNDKYSTIFYSALSSLSHRPRQPN